MHKTDTPVRFWNVRRSVLGTSTGFGSDVIKWMSYAILKNIIIRSKYDASARHPMVHAIPHKESIVTAWTCPKVIAKIVFFTFPFANPSCGLFYHFFLLHNLSKRYSMWFTFVLAFPLFTMLVTLLNGAHPSAMRLLISRRRSPAIYYKLIRSKC